MDFDINLVFVNLNAAAVEAVNKTYHDILLSNTAFDADGKFINKTGDYQVVLTPKTEKTKLNIITARPIFVKYFTAFAGKKLADTITLKMIAYDKASKTCKLDYHFEMFKNFKECINIMKDNMLIHEATATKKPDFEISSNQLLGKLHDAAVKQFNDKYGDKCTIVNTAIDDTKNPSICRGRPGTYKIIVKQYKKGIFGSTSAARKAVLLYLTVFAGEDVAKDLTHATFFTRRSKIKNNKFEEDGITGYSVYYKLKLKANESVQIQLDGTKQHIFECKKQYNKYIMAESNNKNNNTKAGVLVAAIMNDNNVKAEKTLTLIMKKKVEKRISTTLA